MPGARERGLSTRLLLLMEVHNGRHTRLKTLAQRLDVTVQAVSESLRRLAHEGLVHNEEGVWKPTPQGTDWLHHSFLDLKRFIDEAMGDLAIIDECLALAHTDIQAGQNVGLFMSQGHLWADPGRRSQSRGVSRRDVPKGGLLLVHKLRGVVDLRPGKLLVIVHPPEPTAAQWTVLRRRLAKANGAALAVHDTAARAVATRLRRQPQIEFAPQQAALDAARRGVDVVYLAPQRDAPAVLAALSEAKDAYGDPIKVRSVEI